MTPTPTPTLPPPLSRIAELKAQMETAKKLAEFIQFICENDDESAWFDELERLELLEYKPEGWGDSVSIEPMPTPAVLSILSSKPSEEYAAMKVKAEAFASIA